MTRDPSFTPALRSDLLRQDIDQEAVVWSPTRSDPVALDPVAAVLLDVIDGSATMADLANDVHEVVGIPFDVAIAQVDRIVGLLDDAGALLGSEPPSVVERQRELFLNPPST